MQVYYENHNFCLLHAQSVIYRTQQNFSLFDE